MHQYRIIKEKEEQEKVYKSKLIKANQGNSLRVTIPADIVKKLSLKPQDELIFETKQVDDIINMEIYFKK